MSIFIFQLLSFYSIASFFFLFLSSQKLFTINNTISLLFCVLLFDGFWKIMVFLFLMRSIFWKIFSHTLSFSFMFYLHCSFIAGAGNNSKFEFPPNSTPVFPVNHCDVLVTWSISVWLEQDNTQMIKFMPFWSVFP